MKNMKISSMSIYMSIQTETYTNINIIKKTKQLNKPK